MIALFDVLLQTDNIQCNLKLNLIYLYFNYGRKESFRRPEETLPQ